MIVFSRTICSLSRNTHINIIIIIIYTTHDVKNYSVLANLRQSDIS